MVQQTLFKQPSYVSPSSKVTSFNKRVETIFKKARELWILCGTEDCLILYGLDGELKTWPEDRKRVKAMAQTYWALNETTRRKRRLSLQEFREKNDKNDLKKKVIRVSKVKYPVWEFDNYYSMEKLTVLIQSFEHALIRFRRRIHAVVEAHGQREIQNRNMGNQEFMMTTTMNHLHQQSNQVSVVPFNNVNGNISQIPVPLNQGQSLAPIPPELMIYQNSDVGNYQGSFGVQGTLISEFQNMNLNTNMYIRNNFNVEDYNNYCLNANSPSHNLFNIQHYPTQQPYNNNYNVNANSHSHKLVQYPTQNHYNNNYSVNANSLSHQPVQYPTQQQNGAFNSDQYGNNIRSFHDHA